MQVATNLLFLLVLLVEEKYTNGTKPRPCTFIVLIYVATDYIPIRLFENKRP